MPRDITEAQARAVRRTDLDRLAEAREDVESCRVIPVAERVENYRRAYGSVNEAREDMGSRREVPATEAETREWRRLSVESSGGRRMTMDFDWSGFTDQAEAFAIASQAVNRCERSDTQRGEI
jgi:hypothetical protein